MSCCNVGQITARVFRLIYKRKNSVDFLKFAFVKRCTMFNMKSDPKKLVEKHQNLVHSELLKVVSHTQREKDGWVLHTVMVEDCDVAFKFKRKGNYQSLKGARVNMTYYPDHETVAGMSIEIMKVVRIKRG